MTKKRVVLVTIPTKPAYIQIGLYNLKAYALQYNDLSRKLLIDIKIIEPKKFIVYKGDRRPYFDNNFLLYYAKDLSKNNTDMIGFSCFSWNIKYIIKMCQIIKSIRPHILIVLGGPEVSVDSDKILKREKNIDIIVRDEGEETFSNILRSVFFQESKLKDIRGLSFRYGNKVTNNPSRQLLNLDTIPSPYLNDFVNLSDNVTMTIETSRGCPFKCAYCSYSARNRETIRFFPIEKVKNELKYLLNKDVKELWINDDNFNINPKRAKEILLYIKKYIRRTHIHTFLNASMWRVDDNLIKLIKKTKVSLTIGVQTINKKSLLIINRKNDLINMEDNLRRFDKQKLSYSLQFIAGLPGDTYKDLKKNLDWASQFRSKLIQVFLLYITKGTMLYQNARILGLRVDNKYFQSDRYVKETKEIKRKEMLKVRRLIHSIDLLYNAGLLKKTISLLVNKNKLSFSNILEEWGKVNKIIIKNKNYLKNIQIFFLKHIIAKYNIKTNDKELKKLMKNDLNTFFNNISQVSLK